MHELAGYVPDHVSVVAMLALALWLVALNPRHRAYQAFSALLFVRALSNINGNEWIHDRGAADALFILEGATEIALPFLAVVFGLVYPWRRRLLIPWLWWAVLIGGMMAAEAAFFAQPDLLYRLQAQPEGGFEAREFGPLWTLAYLQGVMYAGLTLLFVRDGLRVPAGPLRSGLLWNAAGWGALSAFGAPAFLVWLIRDQVPLEFGGPIIWYMLLAGFIPLVAIVWLARAGLRQPAEFIGPARGFFTVIALAYATGAAVWFWNPNLVGPLDLSNLFVGLWRLAIPILVTYALLRHRLFDIDLKVKWTVKQGTVAGAFVAVFFVVSEGVKGFFETSLGPIFGLGAAGILIFAIQPLQRAAERVSNRVMPDVQNTEGWRAGKKLDLFRTAVTMALQDRVLTSTEEQHLADLADQLGLSHAEALRIRRQIEDKVGAPKQNRTGLSDTPKRARMPGQVTATLFDPLWIGKVR